MACYALLSAERVVQSLHFSNDKKPNAKPVTLAQRWGLGSVCNVHTLLVSMCFFAASFVMKSYVMLWSSLLCVSLWLVADHPPNKNIQGRRNECQMLNAEK